MSKFIQTHFFSSFHFSISNQNKKKEIKIFYILSLFYPPTIFYPPTLPFLQPNDPSNFPSHVSTLSIKKHSNTHKKSTEKPPKSN